MGNHDELIHVGSPQTGGGNSVDSALQILDMLPPEAIIKAFDVAGDIVF